MQNVMLGVTNFKKFTFSSINTSREYSLIPAFLFLVVLPPFQLVEHSKDGYEFLSSFLLIYELSFFTLFLQLLIVESEHLNSSATCFCVLIELLDFFPQIFSLNLVYEFVGQNLDLQFFWFRKWIYKKCSEEVL